MEYKKNWIILSILWILSQIYTFYIKIQNSDIWYTILNWTKWSGSFSDWILWFFIHSILLYIWIIVLLYSIWIKWFNSNIWWKIYNKLNLSNIKYWFYINFIIKTIIFIWVISYFWIKIKSYEKISWLENILSFQFIALILIIFTTYLFIKALVNKKFWIKHQEYEIKKHKFLFIIYIIFISSLLLIPELIFFYKTWGIENYNNFLNWLLK